jgi:hypothetical protein
MAITLPRNAALLLAALLPISPAALAPAAAHDTSTAPAGHNSPDRGQAMQVAIASGDTLEMGRGSIRSFVRKDSAGRMTALGVTFNAAALEALPTADAEYVLPLRVEGTAPFKEIAVNWNPRGHEPPGVYDVPHFDFHFYMIDEQGRDEIAVDDAGMARITKAPAAASVPAGYVPAPGGVPRMGAHYVDPGAFPELHGGHFTSSPIFGYYDGRLTFYEPMVALSYLREKPTLTAPLKAPAAVPVSGRYPTAYSVVYDPATQSYTVQLEGMRDR